MRALAALILLLPLHAQIQSGRPYPRLVVRNAIVVDGTGAPAAGPKDIVIENGLIARIVSVNPVAIKEGRAKHPEGDAFIDAAGKYVLPGFINAHAHAHDNREGIAQPPEYAYKLWLAAGITTIRNVGGGDIDFTRLLADRERSRKGELAAPRIFAYGAFWNQPLVTSPEQARERMRILHKQGADGAKMGPVQRDVMQAALEEAKSLGLRVAHHMGVEETNAWDAVKLGVTSIEHWYGIPDAALDGTQNFPASFNYNDETDRFRYAGRLWREANPKRLRDVLGAMAKANVSWVPTMAIYEASRDIQRAQTQPWFRDYLHPALSSFFTNPASHGSFFRDWTSTDETFWRENYRLWMKALVDFERLGGRIGVGEDAGYILQVYGFCFLRELELHQEAGFHPLQVIRHATVNNAEILGEQDRLGRLRPGYSADLIVVNGNPLADLRVLYPPVERFGEIRSTPGGIEWTVKQGIPYHVPALLEDVKRLVADARAVPKTKNR